ncbi:MAG: 50S ribosome-binding GTPase, partial [Clostridia bacterium]|nr:50S ribosome-binding GTPase [Clostridia bacterium]
MNKRKCVPWKKKCSLPWDSQERIDTMDKNFRSGFIAVVGRANVGKSTIINRLTGEKISIISNKPQTTRNRILAIRTDETSQMIFVDTPGVHNARNKLGEFMNSEARGAVGDADAVLLMVSAL